MSTWASLVVQTQEPAATCQAVDDITNRHVAVVDTNAIIDLGSGIDDPDTLFYTTTGVLSEIRDPASRGMLAAMRIRTRQPSQAALHAIRAFAQKTGDLQQLSEVDLSLLALTYTLEAELHGVSHLRTSPPPVQSHCRRNGGAQMPGWGNNDGIDWTAVDAVPELCDEITDGPAKDRPSEGRGSLGREASASLKPVGEGWELAKQSRNAARRAKRKGKRHNEGQAIMCEVEGTTVENKASERDSRLSGVSASGCRAEEECDVDESSDEGEGGSGSGSESEIGGDRDAGAPFAPRSQIAIVTRDFPMQNVALQMGLRLETKGGARIQRVQRAVLRCEGCHTVCKDTSKIFCPACGHATLSRVAVTVGSDGAEQYGIRKKHVLKGTRFSLPKPRGGHRSANPILSEDVYNARVRKPRRPKGGEEEEGLASRTSGAPKQPPHVQHALAYLQTNWRNNPNERKAVARSNRRR